MNPMLIKLAIRQALKPDNLKKLLLFFAGILLTLVLLPVMMFMTISSIDNGLVNDQFDLKQTDLYQAVNPVYEAFLDEMLADMQAEADQIIEEHTTTDTDPETGEETSECDVDVTVTLNRPGLCPLLAYLSLTDPEIKASKKYKVNQAEILKFYHAISQIEITNQGDDYYIQNVVLSPEQIAERYFSDKADADFYLTSYQNYLSFLPEDTVSEENQGHGQWTDQLNGSLVFGANGMNIPLFKQGGGQPWSNMPYGDGTIATSGCGPTALSMVITYLTGTTVTPGNVVSWTGNRYHQAGVGSTWSLFPACAAHWGLQCKNIGKDSQSLVTALSNGQPVIASMGKGTFTKGGHFIVLRGITADGEILVNDPNDNDQKDHLHKKFPLALITREAKNFWSFQ